jgi:flavin reductase (DIM6/NTAB) family NADH-FMN oxidoreductase RutF
MPETSRTPPDDVEQVGAEIVVETLLWLEAEIESVCTFSLRENALVFT